MVRYLRIDSLIGFGELDLSVCRIAHRLSASTPRKITIVFPKVFLRLHTFHGFPLELEHCGDIQQHLWFELAHFSLMRLEQKDRRSAQLLSARRITGGLRAYASVPRASVGLRVVSVVRVIK